MQYKYTKMKQICFLFSFADYVLCTLSFDKVGPLDLM